ncbi:MAG: nucleoside monophosphate kinase [Holosporales bacterium]|jgi:adenylate kinase|nr:nucleoside monophosphate kinase [Holosporales bacterium]
MTSNNGLWIVFLGAPGCGKGTQAESLISENNFTVICVGDILRNSKGKVVQEFGKTVGELVDAGILLPDDVISNFVRDELKKISNVASKNILFDGFPRTLGQAEALSKLSEEFGKSISKVLNFVIDDEVIFKRILGRYKCAKCGKIYNDFFLKPKVDNTCDVCGGNEFSRRADDNKESLQKRLSEYYEKTRPLIDFYLRLNVLCDVKADVCSDARMNIMKVRSSILEVLDLNEN